MSISVKIKASDDTAADVVAVVVAAAVEEAADGLAEAVGGSAAGEPAVAFGCAGDEAKVFATVTLETVTLCWIDGVAAALVVA